MLIATSSSPNTRRLAPPHGSSSSAAPRTQRRRALQAAALFGALALSACGGPPPPPPTIVELKITATPGVNPTQAGVGAPVVLRVYQLASTAGFEKAEFFRLLNADTATLGTDLAKKDEYLLAPGANKTETLTIPDTVHALGVIAAYREFKDVVWRVTVPIPAHKTTPVLVTAGSGLVVGPAP
jgi:type VI secretion system protein VasD